MQIHYLVPDLQLEACAVVRNLSINSTNQAQIIQCNGIKHLVHCMCYHQNSAEIQEEAICALWNVSLVNGEDRKLQIAREGGITLILQALKKYSMQPTLQEIGVGAIRELAVIEICRTRIVKEGGLPIIIAAIKNHTEHPKIQQYALEALRNLAANHSVIQNHKMQIVKEGALPPIMNTMTKYAHNVSIQNVATILLDELSLDAIARTHIQRLQVITM